MQKSFVKKIKKIDKKKEEIKKSLILNKVAQEKK
jgi:hypothetical protein